VLPSVSGANASHFIGSSEHAKKPTWQLARIGSSNLQSGKYGLSDFAFLWLQVVLYIPSKNPQL